MGTHSSSYSELEEKKMDGVDFDLELPNFKRGSIEWKMCLKIAELTQVIQLLFNRSEANELLVKQQTESGMREVSQLKLKVVELESRLSNESERYVKCEEQYKTELEDVMEQYRKERGDFDRRLKDRNKIGKKYLELEKKYEEALKQILELKNLSDSQDDEVQRLAGNLTNEKRNSTRIKAELQSAKSTLAHRETELGRQFDNVQKLNAAVANLETHRALLQQKVVEVQRSQSRFSYRPPSRAHSSVSRSQITTSAVHQSTSTVQTQTDDYLQNLISGYEKNISDLEKQVRLAEMSVPSPVEFGFMALPKRNRLPSRAKTAAVQLRQLGCLADSSRRAVSALHARPISVSNLNFPPDFCVGQ